MPVVYEKTETESQCLSEMQKDREINHCHLLKAMTRQIQNQHTPKKSPGSVGRGSKTDVPCPLRLQKILDRLPGYRCQCLNAWQTTYADLDAVGMTVSGRD